MNSFKIAPTRVNERASCRTQKTTIHEFANDITLFTWINGLLMKLGGIGRPLRLIFFQKQVTQDSPHEKSKAPDSELSDLPIQFPRGWAAAIVAFMAFYCGGTGYEKFGTSCGRFRFGDSLI